MADLITAMERSEVWAHLLIPAYIISHLVSAVIIFQILMMSWNFFRKRRSVKIVRFFRIAAFFMVLVALNQIKMVAELHYLYVFGFVFLDLLIIVVGLFLMFEAFRALRVLSKYYTPAQLDKYDDERWDAALTSNLHTRSRWTSHLDEINTARMITRELSIPDNYKVIEEIKHRLDALAELGEGDQSEFFDLNESLATAKEELAEEIEARGLEIMSEELPIVHCYPEQMQWLFTEMIKNVIKHNEEPEPTLVIFEEELKEDWVIMFEDNGEGMYPKHQRQFFQLFKVNEDDRLNLSKGMGLALCRRIMRNHRGHIWMESDYYSGVVMYVTIPKYLVLNPREIPEYTYPE